MSAVKPLRSELHVLFGEIENGEHWPDEAKHMVELAVPPLLQVRLNRRQLYVNRAIAGPLTVAFANILERGLQDQVKSFDGCYCIRKQRGDLLRLSVHAWGMAVDINAATNQLGTRGDIPVELVKCFTDAGFIWGGEWHRPDPMHFQFVTED